MPKTAVLVDGGFYRKRAIALWGNKNPKHRAEELNRYVFKHLAKKDGDRGRELYRVFYYDCPPVSKKVYHPKLGRTVAFGKVAWNRLSSTIPVRRKRKRVTKDCAGRLISAATAGACLERNRSAHMIQKGEHTQQFE